MPGSQPNGAGPQWFPQQYQFGPPPGSGPPPKSPRRHQKVFLTIAAAVVVIAVVVTGVIAFTKSGGSGDAQSTKTSERSGAATASEAVKGYLDALARGHAEAALSYGARKAPDATFLTDDVLKSQLAHVPITNPKVLGEQKIGGLVAVEAAADFGTDTSERELQLPPPQGDGGWKLDRAFVSADFHAENANVSPAIYDTFTLFGKPLPEKAIAFLFPGDVDLGSTNPNLVVTTRSDGGGPGLDGLTTGTTSVYPFVDVTKEAVESVRQQIIGLMTTCVQSHVLVPKGCPFSTAASDRVVPGSVNYRYTTDLNGLDFGFIFRPEDGTLSIHSSIVRLDMTWTTVSGSAGNGRIFTFINGTADMLQNPPTPQLDHLN